MFALSVPASRISPLPPAAPQTTVAARCSAVARDRRANETVGRVHDAHPPMNRLGSKVLIPPNVCRTTALTLKADLAGSRRDVSDVPTRKSARRDFRV